jgi:glycosyltransferase involved in cell wall biosynthesis
VTEPALSLTVPVYNQADHIDGVLQDYTASLERINLAYELIVVVNGRRNDNSLAICQAFAADKPNVRVLCTDDAGWGRAVRIGLAESKGEMLAYTNAARTSAEELALVALYGMTHPGVVIKANRKIRDSHLRRLGSLLYNLECRYLFDLPQWDVNGTPKLFWRNNRELLQLSRNDDLIDLEFNVICRRAGYRMLEVPTLSSARRGGRSTTNYKSALNMYIRALGLHYARG